MSILDKARKLRAAMTAAAPALDDATASTVPEMFPRLKSNGELVKAGTRINWNGTVKKAAADLWDTAENTPDAAPALWVAVSVDAWPEWVQPTGAHDAYHRGDKVSYNGKHYICTADANVYAPGVSGWEETVK